MTPPACPWCGGPARTPSDDHGIHFDGIIRCRRQEGALKHLDFALLPSSNFDADHLARVIAEVEAAWRLHPAGIMPPEVAAARTLLATKRTARRAPDHVGAKGTEEVPLW